MDAVRVGVIGLGIMGELYSKIYACHPWARLVAVSSRRQARVDEIRSRHDVPEGYTDYRDMLDRAGLDAVVVATPDHHHAAPARAALEAGRHVLVEKPFTTSVSEADELIDLARRTRRHIQVAYNHRWLAPYHQARAAIQAGQLGTPLAGFARKNDTIFVPTELISWAGETTPAWFLSSHDIDLMRWFFDAEPLEARAWGRRELLASRGVPTYDVIQAQVRFSSGAIATFESGWVYPNTFPTIVDSFVEVIATGGHVHLDRKRESIEISTGERFSYPKCFLTHEIFGRVRGAFPSCLEDFLVAVREDTPPRVTGFDGRQVTAALEAIHRSLDSGRTEPVSPPPSSTA
ncbi:MAG: Gfo/Idh/MocA family oxidoreductase [Acidobacteria bacterium]|nr:Gfo/Idh/MocA family oxidoreductase [Acidobacteriota bacterium]